MPSDHPGDPGAVKQPAPRPAGGFDKFEMNTDDRKFYPGLKEMGP